MTLKQIFGKNIKYYRYENKLTQEQLSEKANINPKHLGEIENGKYSTSFDNVEQIAKVLNVETYKLFQETEKTHKNLPSRVDMYKN